MLNAVLSHEQWHNTLYLCIHINIYVVSIKNNGWRQVGGSILQNVLSSKSCVYVQPVGTPIGVIRALNGHSSLF